MSCTSADEKGVRQPATKTVSPDTAPWRRVLWARQPYPDNYTPCDFLSGLQAGSSDHLPSFSALFLGSQPLTQRFCTILLLIGLFLHLQEGSLAFEVLALASIGAICACGVTMPTSRAIAMPHGMRKQGGSTAKVADAPRRSSQPLSYALLALFILAVSPLLKTLTEATTSDSIAALSTSLFLASFALADFKSGISGAARGNSKSAGTDSAAINEILIDTHNDPLMAQSPLPAAMSLNAALCASTVLASRLDSPIAVFALVLAAIFLFAFWPRWIKFQVARQARMRSMKQAKLFNVAITSALLISSALLLAPFSRAAAITDVVVAAFLSVVCPAWMRRAQRFKVSRRGPWDVSVPRIRLPR